MYAGIEFDTGTADTAEVIDTINGARRSKVAANAAISIKIDHARELRAHRRRFAFDYARARTSASWSPRSIRPTS